MKIILIGVTMSYADYDYYEIEMVTIINKLSLSVICNSK